MTDLNLAIISLSLLIKDTYMSNLQCKFCNNTLEIISDSKISHSYYKCSYCGKIYI